MVKPVEPGCLAIIVQSDVPENIGRVVEVIHWDVEDKTWFCEAGDALMATQRVGGRHVLAVHGHCEDRQLMRIDGDVRPQKRRRKGASQ
ncbi:hypothetical protein [Halomonas sp. NO4]|uniref:hypothetical protein n=1 Tax=Halomonas sp. NO4 TaxID=2484813 RepID=UPI0013D61B36|nr:hypothetical protein [Halomonas sp. NO4]